MLDAHIHQMIRNNGMMDKVAVEEESGMKRLYIFLTTCREEPENYRKYDTGT